jgi:DNA replication protein DnaC
METCTSFRELDEVGYLPIDQRGADLLFQVISQHHLQ